jgi:hypothetical protein
MTCRKIAVATLAAVLASGALAACGQGSEHASGSKGGAVDDTPSSVRSTDPSTGPSTGPSTAPSPAGPASSCRPVPVSTGPAADLVVVEASAPASAPSGATVPVRVSLHVRRDGPRIVTTTARSQLLVVRDGQVVGTSPPPASRLSVPLPLRAGAVRPGQVVPETVRLSGCATSAGGSVQPLPPGRYGIVAVLAYGQDALSSSADGGVGARAAGPGAGSSRRFHLVSRPAPIDVT